MDMSNKNLALILVAAIVISLGGTIVSLSKLGSIGEEYAVTGYATTQGVVNVSITKTITLNVSDTVIQFGKGAFEEGFTYCALYSNDTDTMIPTGCGNWTWSADFLEFKNIGSVAIDVNFTSSQAATALLGASDNSFKYYCLNTSASSISDVTTWTEVTTATQDCIESLDTTLSDRFYAMFNVSTNSTTGSDRTATLTFAASES